MASNAVDGRLQEAWEKARKLSDFRKCELIDFIGYLHQRDEENEMLDLSEEDIRAIEGLLTGADTAEIPWDQVKREVREARDSVRD
jgi:hypothetical protein